jgi:hypothetical protein
MVFLKDHRSLPSTMLIRTRRRGRPVDRRPCPRRSKRLRTGVGSERGVGGFYGSIMALMVVTAGVLILTSSFAIISHRTKEVATTDAGEARAVLDRLLADPDLFSEDHVLHRSALDHYEWTAIGTLRTGQAVEVWVAYQDGTTTCYQSGNGSATGSSYVASEPINVLFNQGDVRVALLSVRVIP